MYLNRKIKFSQSNKRKNKFKPRLGYIRYIICQALNCHNSRYIEEEKVKFKAQYFVARKAKNIKPINKTFKAYLAYANQAKQDLESIWDKIKD